MNFRLSEEKIISLKQARFLFVGLINTIVGYSIYALLIFLNVPYLTALFGATLTGVVFNYFSIGLMVFKSQGGLTVFVKFFLAYGIVYFVNAIGLKVLIVYFQIGPYLGQFICVPISVILSWILMNYWVYKND